MAGVNRQVSVSAMSRKQKILATLVSGRRLCDDCLSDICDIKPRQSVNQACSRLHEEKLISRLTDSCEGCTRLKITNALFREPEEACSPPLTGVRIAESLPSLLSRTPSFPSVGKSELSTLVSRFVEFAIANKIEIYNEFSLQHELGIFLRNELPSYLVQFERNIKYFSASKFPFTKRELDIAVFSKDKTELKYAIELKYPRNGQHPETMFSFCKDIAFIEELKIAGFSHAALLILVDDHLFYSGSGDGIYGFFRSGKPVAGRIEKPTGLKNDYVTVKGSYVVSWSDVADKTKYAVVEV